MDAGRFGEAGGKLVQAIMMNLALLVSSLLFSVSVVCAQDPKPSPAPTPTLECLNATVMRSRDLDKRVKIKSKPSASFSEDEVQDHPNEVVVLRALFCGTNAKVTDIKVVKGVTLKLDEAAIAAARKIKFEPAEKNGQRVSQWLQIEYSLKSFPIRPE